MKRINFKDRKVLYGILGIVLVSIFTLTIAYAALNTILTISGTAQVNAADWDIYLSNPKVTNGSVNTDVPEINGNTLNFNTTLNMPGDFYEFTVEVVNDGSIDAMISNVTKNPELTAEQAKYLKYEVTYQNGEAISNQQLLAKNTSMPIKVRVEYRNDLVASDLPSTSTTLNLSLSLEYIQNDGTGSSVNNNGAEKKLINVVSGDGTKTSDEVCIGEECFYVMYSDDTSITMLAKYNLYVGGEFDGSWKEYGDEATGKQDSTMLGYETTSRKGTTKFSNTKYWSSTVSSYPAYVYDSNSTLYSYVENYKTYLSTLGVTPTETRLITYEELTSLGCSGSSCKNAPSWVYATSYWSGAANSSNNVWYVDSTGYFGSNFYTVDASFGCRPVIVISRDLIDVSGSGEIKTLIEFTIDDTTYQAEEGMTWAEWVESEYNTTDLYVSTECDAIRSDTKGCISEVKNWNALISNTINYTYCTCYSGHSGGSEN